MIKISVRGRPLQRFKVDSLEQADRVIRNLIQTLQDHRIEYADAINLLYASATEAQLNDIGDNINIKGKFAGKRVYVTDRATPAYVYTNGATAGSVWLLLDDPTTTAYTPV